MARSKKGLQCSRSIRMPLINYQKVSNQHSIVIEQNQFPKSNVQGFTISKGKLRSSPYEVRKWPGIRCRAFKVIQRTATPSTLGYFRFHGCTFLLTTSYFVFFIESILFTKQG